jgi:hypothetical protein
VIVIVIMILIPGISNSFGYDYEQEAMLFLSCFTESLSSSRFGVKALNQP